MQGHDASEHPLPPACETLEPIRLDSPLVFSSPHSGHFYPPDFLAASRLDLRALRSSEDVAVDDLFSAAPLHGAPLLRASYPRAFLDVNREAGELDGRLFDQPLPAYANTRSLRVAGGLGAIPRVVAEGQAIYPGRIPLSEGLERIEKLYKPYHAALEALMNRAAQKFGGAVLVDCHSMPSHMPTGDSRRPYEPIAVDIVIGDRHGASCDPALTHRIHAILSGLGYRVARNKPYAGGFITETYALRQRNRHAVQIEINRALYLDEKTLEPGPDYARVKADLSFLVAEIAPGREMPGAPFRQAAE
jgi:N-formylglutamate amidohydrolase